MPPHAMRLHSLLQERMKCRWKGSKDEIYELEPLSKTSWAVYRTANAGVGHCKEFTIWLEEGSGLVWWGSGSYFFHVAKFEGNPGRITWYPRDSSKLPFKWNALDPLEEPRSYDGWRGESGYRYDYKDHIQDSHEKYPSWREGSRWFGKSYQKAGWESEWTGERSPALQESEPEPEELPLQLRKLIDDDGTSAGHHQEAGKHLLGILRKGKDGKEQVGAEATETIPELASTGGPLPTQPIQEWEPPTSPPEREPTIPHVELDSLLPVQEPSVPAREPLPMPKVQDASSRPLPPSPKPQQWRDLVVETNNLAMHWWLVAKSGEAAYRDMLAANEAAVQIAREEEAHRPTDVAAVQRARQAQQKAFDSSKSCIDAIMRTQAALAHFQPQAPTMAAAALQRASGPPGALPPVAMPSAVLSPAAFSLASMPPMAPSSSMPCVTLPTAPAPVPGAVEAAVASPALSAVSDLHPTGQPDGTESLSSDSLGSAELPPGLPRPWEQSSAERALEVRRSKGQKMPRPDLEAKASPSD